MSKEVRLQKFIADCGITSRRKAEDLILDGKVKVNGKLITVLGSKVNIETDAVSVDGKIADLKFVKPIYLLMNKPRAYMTTLMDPEGRRTVMDLCMEVSERIYPVGRLDYLSEGLLLMTNDGEIANQVMHPRFDIVKVYEVKVFGKITPRLLKALKEGVQLPEGLARPISVRVIKQLPTKTWLEFRLGEGRNREIRKICDFCDVVVDKLRRVAIGNLSVEGIAPGNYKLLSKKELVHSLGLKGDVYQSMKKTIPLKGKAIRGKGTNASDERFKKFKKETYFDSLKAIETSKKLALKKIREEEYNLKEEAFAKRKRNKELRQKKKEEKIFAPHAIVLKD